MLLNLLSQSNYGRFNLKIAQIIGLEASVYLEELLDINDKAIRKEKIRKESTDDDLNIYFIVDREYIQSRTTITPAKQQRLDEKLISVGVLYKRNPDDAEMSIDVFGLAGLVDGDPSKLKKIAKNSTKTSRITKNEEISQRIKSKLKIENLELRSAYYDWIDTLVQKGSLSIQAVNIFSEAIDNFSDRNLDVALEILNIATVNGWRDPHWSIKAYKERHGITGNKVSVSTKF